MLGPAELTVPDTGTIDLITLRMSRYCKRGKEYPHGQITFTYYPNDAHHRPVLCTTHSHLYTQEVGLLIIVCTY